MKIILAPPIRIFYALLGILLIGGGVYLMWDFLLQFFKFVLGLILFFAGLGFLFKRYRGIF
ncbi:TPA: hypothetical protein HA249_03650 [Candidatus Woesearchaeota archaeon]|nr:hypothetical protein [Candidatus Woesearchaeota archaeon]HIH47422.1 hypothetical protein [Candidatus Woesearchaeota archaeon]